MKVLLNDVIDAIDAVNDEDPAYYLIREERIVYPSSQGIDITYDEAIPLPDRRQINDYRNMEKFINTVEDGAAKEWLSNAIRGRGAFRMFRSALERFHLTDDWYDFLDRMHKYTAIGWCDDNGIEYQMYEEEQEDEEDDWLHEDYSEVKEPVQTVPKQVKIPAHIVQVSSSNLIKCVYLAASDAQERDRLYGIRSEHDTEASQERLEEYLKEGCVIFACSDQGRFTGYAVAGPGRNPELITVYTAEDSRRKKIGTMLLKKIVTELGEPEILVSPLNTAALMFFAANGYGSLSALRLAKDEEAEGQKSVRFGNALIKY